MYFTAEGRFHHKNPEVLRMKGVFSPLLGLPLMNLSQQLGAKIHKDNPCPLMKPIWHEGLMGSSWWYSNVLRTCFGTFRLEDVDVRCHTFLFESRSFVIDLHQHVASPFALHSSRFV